MKVTRHTEDERLWQAIDEMDAEMERDGVEDATAWEKFPEYERILYAIGEREVERKRRFEESWEFESEQIIELAEMAEEAAIAELEAFGYWDEYDDFIDGFAEVVLASKSGTFYEVG